MADGKNTEAVELPLNQQPNPDSKTGKFRGWLKIFDRNSRNTAPTIPQIPETQELQKSPKSVNELLGVKEADALRLAQNILFHTAPVANLEKLKSQGLFAQKDDPNLGNNIGYSTFFAVEHHLKKTGQSIPLDGIRSATPDDYVLTIWRRNNSVLKEKGTFKEFGFYQPSMEPPPGTPLEEYIDAAISGNKAYEWFGDFAREIIAKDVRMVPGEYFAESIQLDTLNRNLIIKNMVLAEIGIAGSDQIEQSFKGITSGEIAHAMAVSIERNLIRNSIMEQIKAIKAQPRQSIEISQNAFIQAMFLRTKVNDKISALYLDKSIDWLAGILKKQGIDPQKIAEENALKIKHFNQNPQGTNLPVKLLASSRNFDFYGSNEASYAASDIKRELSIAA